MTDIKSMTEAELTAYFNALGQPAFRAKQVFTWLHRGVRSFDEMSNLSKSLRQQLAQDYTISVPTVARKQESRLDGTTVLVSSHNLRELEDVCDHVGIMNKGRVLLERSLSELQDNTVKLQVAYAAAEEPPLPEGIRVLHRSAVGRVITYIVRGKREDILHRMQALSPLLLEAIPLTLEEIFIYELGGADYAVRDIVL